MIVKIDLRPEKAPRKKVNLGGVGRIFALLVVLMFIAVSAVTMTFAGLKYQYMKSSINTIQNDIERLQVQDIRLGEELERLQAEENNYSEALKLLEEELPTLEFLTLLENAQPEGVWLETIQVKPGTVSLKGKAWEENDVVIFAKALLDNRLVYDVGFPETSRGRPGPDGMSIVDFRFNCLIVAITDIPARFSGGGN